MKKYIPIFGILYVDDKSSKNPLYFLYQLVVSTTLGGILLVKYLVI
tara:strand:- start:1151 stop:1288 length:138 start_codon:yes stop_codon:yes gene_type:complete